MKALIASLVGLFVVLSVTNVVAVTFDCPVCNHYNSETGAISKQVVPDELVKLDGTLGTYTANLPDGYYVVPAYTWLQYILPGCGVGDCIPDSCSSDNPVNPGGSSINFVTGYDNDDPSIWMYAPHNTGCYMVVLTADHLLYKTVDGKDEIPGEGDDELIVTCTKMACFLMCVQETECPVCSAIFCDQYCGQYLKYHATTCPSYDADTVGYLCYPVPEPAGINIVWYVVEATAMPTGDATAIATYLGSATIVEKLDARCFDPDLCNESPKVTSGDGRYQDYGSSTYQIIMTIENSAYTIVDWCPVGTLVMVEDPVAAIAETS